MEDIIVDGPSPTSIQSRNSKKFIRKEKKEKRDLSVYLFDWLIKGLLVALLLSIDFVLFAGAGNFGIFASGYSLAPQVLYVLIGFFAVSIILMFLLSFSSFLQNLLTAVAGGLFVYVLMHQFALFDETSFLAGWVGNYLGSTLAMNFMGISHILCAWAAGIALFLFLILTRKANIAYFTGIVLLIFVGILGDKYFKSGGNAEFKTVYQSQAPLEEKDGKRFIYIMLPNAGSYNYLEDMKEAVNTEEARKTMSLMLGFFARNGFSFYPHAYVNERDPFMNAVASLNMLGNDKPEDFLLNNVAMDGYWGFDNLNDEYVYLRENQLFRTFKKAKYKISAYKTRGLDLCRVNNEMSADRCIEKVNRPISFDNLNLTGSEKTELLLIQWIESTGLFTDLSAAYSWFKGIGNPDKTPLVGLKYDNLYVVDAVNTLDKVAQDIISDTGNNAYFVVMDMPANMYVYNEYCRVKPTGSWLDMESLPWILNKNLYGKRSAYLSQMNCLFGKLEQFIRNLEKAGAADKSVIVIQGLSGVNDLINIREPSYIQEFKNERLVTMAIRDPLKKKFVNDTRVCSAKDILKEYLFRRGKCEEMKDLNMHDEAKKDFKGMLNQVRITEPVVAAAVKKFDEWYPNWQRLNNPEAKALPKFPSAGKNGASEVSKVITLPPEGLPEEEPEILDITPENIEIGEVKIMDKPVEDLPEVKTEKFQAAVEAAEKKENTEEGTADSLSSDKAALSGEADSEDAPAAESEAVSENENSGLADKTAAGSENASTADGGENVSGKEAVNADAAENSGQ